MSGLILMVHSEPITQIRGQGGVQWLAGAQHGVVDIVPRTAATDFFQVGVEGCQVAVSQRPGVAAQLLRQFQTFEPRGAGEREV